MQVKITADLSAGHVTEYPTMQYLGFPGHTLSMIAYTYKIMTDLILLGAPVKIALWECWCHALLGLLTSMYIFVD